jgi:hypothetical protein
MEIYVVVATYQDMVRPAEEMVPVLNGICLTTYERGRFGNVPWFGDSH